MKGANWEHYFLMLNFAIWKLDSYLEKYEKYNNDHVCACVDNNILRARIIRSVAPCGDLDHVTAWNSRWKLSLFLYSPSPGLPWKLFIVDHYFPQIKRRGIPQENSSQLALPKEVYKIYRSFSFSIDFSSGIFLAYFSFFAMNTSYFSSLYSWFQHGAREFFLHKSINLLNDGIFIY